jgi:hypothetical protein
MPKILQDMCHKGMHEAMLERGRLLWYYMPRWRPKALTISRSHRKNLHTIIVEVRVPGEEYKVA